MIRIFLIAIFATCFMGFGSQAKPRILIFAAASMKNVLEKIGEDYEQDCGCKTVFSFASSGTLARQIEAQAPADIFISADMDWMDWMRERDVIENDAAVIIANNRLIVAVGTEREVDINDGLASIFGKGRIAIANPISVPAGRYGKQALMSTGMWEGLEPQLVYGENVRISLALAARGDVDSAIVYQSDLKIEPRVKAAYLFEQQRHKPILYPAVVLRSNELNRNFFEYLQSEVAQKIFVEFGFSAVKP